MLTVDYNRLGLQRGHRLLDLGCGFGRHAFEALRRGADVVACDMALPELDTVREMCAAMVEGGELATHEVAQVCGGDATSLPFPDGSFDRVIASEILEHVPDDRAALAELTRVLAPGGTMAITVPSWLPETVCWKLSDEYYAPKAEGGHVRIYSRSELKAKIGSAGLDYEGAHHAHGLHSPYWWLKCAVGVNNDDHPLVQQYLRFLTWDIVKRPLTTRLADRILNPVIGKSTVFYATKSSATPSLDTGRARAAA